MRIRFKLRWLMVLVALAAIAIGPGWRYAQELRMGSQSYAFCVASANSARQNALAEANGSGLSAAEREYLKKEAAWHAARAARFQRGVSRPWLEIQEPDLLPPLPLPLPKAPPDPKKDASDEILTALSRLKDTMSPEQYAKIQEKLRVVARMSVDQKRASAERRQQRSQQRMGAGFVTPESPPPASIVEEMMGTRQKAPGSRERGLEP